MAIDPKLLVLKPVSELETVNNPTTGSLLFYDGGDELKKTSVADFYDAMQSAYLGIATTTTTPPATGSYWYRVDTAGTYTNFLSGGSPIVVSAGDLDGNEVTIEVKDNVATKRVKEIPIVDAKLPLYSVIKSAAIVAGTQFIDDENGNIIYRVLAGQTLAVGELPASFPLKVESMGVDVNKKTFVGKNLANPDLIVDGQWINSAGDFVSNANYQSILHVPVTPNTSVIFSGHDPSGATKYVLFEDINKVKIGAPTTSLNTTTKIVNIPANCYYISATIKNPTNAVPTNLQIESGTVATPFEAYTETFAVEKINSSKILASYFQKYVAGTYQKNEIVTDSGKIYRSKVDGNTALLTDLIKWENIGGGSGTTYDQSLNKADNVEFNKINATEVNIAGTLKKGTLVTPPVGLTSLEYWLDTTDSTTNPILRQKQ